MNTGKKYRKYTGRERPLDAESTKRAAQFMNWFAYRFDELRAFYGNAFNDEVATDTALRIHRSIEMGGMRIEGPIRHYFVRAYNMNMLGWHKGEAKRRALYVSIDEPLSEGGETLHEVLESGEIDITEYELAVQLLREEVFDFVRTFHTEYAANLFEMYVELSPDISYHRLADMFGLKRGHVCTALTAVKKDVVEWFAPRKGFLLDNI